MVDKARVQDFARARTPVPPSRLLGSPCSIHALPSSASNGSSSTTTAAPASATARASSSTDQRVFRGTKTAPAPDTAPAHESQRADCGAMVVEMEAGVGRDGE